MAGQSKISPGATPEPPTYASDPVELLDEGRNAPFGRVPIDIRHFYTSADGAITRGAGSTVNP
jgi:hypothetical protein